jgi:hypothetical protein
MAQHCKATEQSARADAEHDDDGVEVVVRWPEFDLSANVAADGRSCSMVAPHNIPMLAVPNSRLLDVTDRLSAAAN